VLTFSFSFSHQDTFGLSFSLVDENLLNFSCSFSHLLDLVTQVSTQSHSTQYALLLAEQHAHFRAKLRLADEK